MIHNEIIVWKRTLAVIAAHRLYLAAATTQSQRYKELAFELYTFELKRYETAVYALQSTQGVTK